MASERQSCDSVDPPVMLRELERNMTGGVANGDSYTFNGLPGLVTAVESGGREGPQVRLEFPDGTQRWVTINLP